MTELEKSFKELLDRHIDFYEPVNQDDLECFFKGTLKPEHMKHTEEVKGLIEALENEHSYAVHLQDVIKKRDKGIFSYKDMTRQALKPFEKGQVNVKHEA